MAGLAEVDHMGQTVWIISVDTKLHKQLEGQETPCACVSLGSHRTADMIIRAVFFHQVFTLCTVFFREL